MSSSPIRGNEPGDLSFALGPKTSSPMLQGVLFLIFLHFIFSLQTTNPPVFITTLKSKSNSQFLTSLKSFIRRKPILVFDPRPLYCSSLTTAVGFRYDSENHCVRNFLLFLFFIQTTSFLVSLISTFTVIFLVCYFGISHVSKAI